MAPVAPIVPASPPNAAEPTGPAADYPIVLGPSYEIDGITHTPEDVLSYDTAGFATALRDDVAGIAGAHKTLPLPSYVEVTDLSSGRTTLVRVTQRGPMTNARLIGLSSGAMAQLGITDGAGVRVRRVNPPEEERATLRNGGEVAPRMATPEGLLSALRRRLPASGPLPLVSRSSEERIVEVDPDRDTPVPQPAPKASEAEEDSTFATRRNTDSATTRPVPPISPGDWVVQAGAYSVQASAERVAADIGGYVEQVGRLWRVRAGPFADHDAASAALAKIEEAGYTDAQIYRIR